MRFSIKRGLLWIVLGLLALFAFAVISNWNLVQRIFLGGVKVYETSPPALPAQLPRPAILVFSKTNGFRHEEAIPAANALFAEMARANAWGHFQTENGATFAPEILARFDAVVFNNVSGDVFTPAQRAALKGFVEGGGGFVGIHGSGGDMSYAWDWYVNELIGAQFTAHPMDPQFQRATVKIEDVAHPVTQGLPALWQRVDEWYSFEKPARRPGFHVLATLDESTYKPVAMFGSDIAMGADHPIVWWHCQGRGRALYSALGHRAEAYSEAEYKLLLDSAVKWALRRDIEDCGGALQ
jgi:type 1 glutamine amidotransferase